MARARRIQIRDLFEGVNNTTRLIVAGGFLLLLIILLPRVIPGGRFGIPCTGLAHPIPGGNNQSVLAERSAGALSIEITLERSDLGMNDPLIVNATFINNGVGAITLFFVPEESLLRDDQTPGLNFIIRRVADNALMSEPTTVRPPNLVRQQFPTETLYILGPRQRCTERLTFDPVRLSNAGIISGNYTIRAIYRNFYPGILDIQPGATATPIFQNQGVYTIDELRSGEVDFSVGIVPPA
jgi:hypothetical protein